jgi:hypothetical protein
MSARRAIRHSSFVIHHSFMPPYTVRPLPPRGLTLVEVCLVLALLVVIGSFAVPIMQGAIERRALNSGVDLVRGAWAKARLAAMQNGQTCAFRFEPGGSRFQIVTLSQLTTPEAGELAPDDAATEREVADMLRIPENRLPEGVTFVAGDVSTSTEVMAMLPELGEGPWSRPILFHPDGTTSDASLLLTNTRQHSIRIALRGLTGISNTTEVGAEALP